MRARRISNKPLSALVYGRVRFNSVIKRREQHVVDNSRTLSHFCRFQHQRLIEAYSWTRSTTHGLSSSSSSRRQMRWFQSELSLGSSIICDLKCGCRACVNETFQNDTALKIRANLLSICVQTFRRAAAAVVVVVEVRHLSLNHTLQTLLFTMCLRENRSTTSDS